jgi:hypothetical protein
MNQVDCRKLAVGGGHFHRSGRHLACRGAGHPARRKNLRRKTRYPSHEPSHSWNVASSIQTGLKARNVIQQGRARHSCARRRGLRWPDRPNRAVQHCRRSDTLAPQRGEISPKRSSRIEPLNQIDLCLREDIEKTLNIPSRLPLRSTGRGAGVRSEITSVVDDKCLRFMGRARSEIPQIVENQFPLFRFPETY